MSSSFSEIFKGVKRDLEARDIEIHCVAAAPATAGDLAAFTAETGIELPLSFSEFFTSFADGYQILWERDGDSGGFTMPSLQELADLHREWRAYVHEFADDPKSMDRCMEKEFRNEAFVIWNRMRSWLPFVEDEDSDQFCVDLPSGKIVFNKHDWFDGFGEIAETNGLIAGHSLAGFLENWARFHFESMWFTDHPHEAGRTELEWGEPDAGE